MDRNLTGTTTTVQNGSGSNGNEGVTSQSSELYPMQFDVITRTMLPLLPMPVLIDRFSSVWLFNGI